MWEEEAPGEGRVGTKEPEPSDINTSMQKLIKAQTILFTLHLPRPNPCTPALWGSALGAGLGVGLPVPPPPPELAVPGQRVVGAEACSVHPLEHVDEIAGNVGLAWIVRLEVAQDAVLALAPKGCSEQLCEGCQTVWVVGEPELTEIEPPTNHEDGWPQHAPPYP